MRMRIISAAVVLGLGIVGIALAQQAGERPKDQGEKAKLRAQVVKLRVEIELLELEHEADREVIVSWMKTIRQAEVMGSARGDTELSLGIMMLEVKASLGDAGAVKEMERIGESGGNEDAFRKALKQSAEKQEASVRAHIDRRKKDFARQAAELAEKRLELAEVEKRYNETR